MELHRQAVKAGMINSSDHDRLAFVAAAEKARMLPPTVRNPMGVFIAILKKRLFEKGYISEGQDEAARLRLRDFDRGPAREPDRASAMAHGLVKSVEAGPTHGQAARPEKSADAKLLQVIRNRGVRDLEAVFRELNRTQGWDRPRFVRARAEAGLE
jgi:hypothetical protein